jgi:hypothetical protein
MKYITPIAVIGILLLQFSGAVPLASVGGPLTLALAFLVAALAVGVHEAWSRTRGVFGWIVSIFVAFLGGLVGASLGSSVLETILVLTATLTQVRVEGSLAASGHPLLYVLLAGQMLFTLFGAWIALAFANRFR